MLELAAGTGEVGLPALPLIAPGGTLICSDQSEAMVELARARAQLGLSIEFRVLGGEWIDLELASVDAVLCRWGYMLMVDPAAALRETRRVLRSGAASSLAVVGRASARTRGRRSLTAVLVEHGLADAPVPGTPGPFALGDAALLRSMLEEAGFTDIVIDAVDIARRAPDFDSWWATHLDLSASSRASFEQAGEAQTAAIEAELAARLGRYASASGELAVPGRTFVAVAQA